MIHAVELCMLMRSLALGFTRALCHEMATRSIRVNALLPGWVDSEMWQSKSFPVPTRSVRMTHARRCNMLSHHPQYPVPALLMYNTLVSLQISSQSCSKRTSKIRLLTEWPILPKWQTPQFSWLLTSTPTTASLISMAD